MEVGGDDKEQHCCRVCGKRFPCGRSLGGHMRSHLSPIPPSSSHDFAKKMITTIRDCSNAGNCITTTTTTTTSNSSRTFMKLSCQLPEPAVKRRRSRRVASIAAAAAASEFDEEEDVALCLMMLSRDSSAKRKQEKLLDHDVASHVFSKREEESEKRPRFACPECNKPFRSYQALGGHRANRKRINGGGCCGGSKIHSLPDNNFDADADASLESAKKARAHRCPICDKVFGSGQALGGHKRSHLMASSSDNRRMRICSINDESRDLLDLNLPAPVDDDEDGDSSNANENVEYKSWWIEGDHNKHESLVGFI